MDLTSVWVEWLWLWYVVYMNILQECCVIRDAGVDPLR